VTVDPWKWQTTPSCSKWHKDPKGSQKLSLRNIMNLLLFQIKKTCPCSSPNKCTPFQKRTIKVDKERFGNKDWIRLTTDLMGISVQVPSSLPKTFIPNYIDIPDILKHWWSISIQHCRKTVSKEGPNFKPRTKNSGPYKMNVTLCTKSEYFSDSIQFK